MDILIIILFIVIFVSLAFGCPIRVEITHKHENVKEDIPEIKENKEIPISNMDDVIKNLNEAMEVFADE